MGAPGHDVTELLRAWGNGDLDTRDRLLPLVHQELRRRAAAFDGRKCRIAELRFFGGLSLQEIGEGLGLSAATVERDWQAGRAWLFKTLSAGGNVA